MTESRVLEMALDTHWAMTETGLRTMLGVVDGWLGADLRLELPPAEDAEDGGGKPEAVSTRTGEELDGAQTARVRDGVAVVPVVGPIFRRGNLITQVSSATSVELLARDLRAAVEDDAVAGILLDVDSPGGEVNGLSEMSDLIFEARTRKPVRAFVSGSGASGGYWLASAASEVAAADTALLGSIGVRTAFIDEREREKRSGIRRIEFVSSQTPRKAPDPTGEDGREEIQSVIDALADVFLDDVARNRDVPRADVAERFGRGRVFVGAEAVERGLADRISTFEDELDRIREARSGPGSTVIEPAARDDDLRREEQKMAPDAEQDDSVEPGALDLDAEALREHYPEAVAEIEADASAAERDRIRSIAELEVPDGYDDLIHAAMFDPDATADSVSRKVLARQSETRKARLEARQGDEEDLEAPRERAGAGDEPEDEGAQEAKRILAAARKAGTLERRAATEA